MANIVSVHSEGTLGTIGLPVDPEEFGELWGYYLMSDAVTSGGAIDTIANRSILGAAIPLTAAGTGTARPTYEAAGFGGRPSALYDGTNDQLRADGLAAAVFTETNSAFTIITPIQWITPAANDYIFSAASSVDPDCVLSLRTNGAAPFKWGASRLPDTGGGSTLTGPTTLDANRHIVSFACDNSGIATLRVDGVVEFTGTFTAGAHTFDRVGFGAYVRTTPTAFGNFRQGNATLIYKGAMDPDVIPLAERFVRDLSPTT